MPESVKMWTEARDVAAMQEALSGIIGAYERDFAKHPNLSEFPKISMIWKSIPVYSDQCVPLARCFRVSLTEGENHLHGD